jgi:hypothetical protein
MPNREQAAELFAQVAAKEVFEKTARTVFHRLEHGPTSNDSSDTMVQQGIALRQWFQSISDAGKEWTRTVGIEAVWAAFHALCYFFDSGACVEVDNGKVVVFPVYLEAYETESQWASRQPPTWKVRISPVNEGVMLQDLEWEQIASMARRNHWEGYLGIEPEPLPPSEVPAASEPFTVGAYNRLRREVPGTCLEVQLVPHGFVAQQVIPNYHYETAPGILLPMDIHYEIHRANPFPYGEQDDSEVGLLPLDREGAASLFTYALQKEVFERAAREVLNILHRGPSWSPTETGDPIYHRTFGLHRWFANLSESDRHSVLSIVRYTTEVAFHALCYFWDGGVHIRSEYAEEIEFVVYLELYEEDPLIQGTGHPVWSVRVCPMRGYGWDLHEVVGVFIAGMRESLE